MSRPRTIDEAVEAMNFGRASAAKRGRNSALPYVPIIDFGEQKIGVHRTHTEQIKGKAFASRDDAVSYAQRAIDARRALFCARLSDPRERALRAQWGVAEGRS